MLLALAALSAARNGPPAMHTTWAATRAVHTTCFPDAIHHKPCRTEVFTDVGCDDCESNPGPLPQAADSLRAPALPHGPRHRPPFAVDRANKLEVWTDNSLNKATKTVTDCKRGWETYSGLLTSEIPDRRDVAAQS